MPILTKTTSSFHPEQSACQLLKYDQYEKETFNIYVGGGGGGYNLSWLLACPFKHFSGKGEGVHLFGGLKSE